MLLIWKDLCAAYYNTLPSKPAHQFWEAVAFQQRQPLDANTAYWKKYIEGLEPALLPTGPKPAERPDGPARVDAGSQVDARRLHAFCQDHGFTTPAVLKAGWMLLMAALTGNTSPCFGYAASGRDADIPGVDEIIGPLLTLCLCRMTLRTDESFESLISRMQLDHFDHLAHQQYHFNEAIPV